jgi:hypothetical protein
MLRIRAVAMAMAVLASVAARAPVHAAVVPPAARGTSLPSTETPPPPEIALGLLQGVAGYALEIGGVLGAVAIGLNPKNLGWSSDAGNAIFVGAMAPALAAGAVCATGLLSSRYRGRCAPTFLGAYAGAALGALLGVLVAPSPGPDDTQAFVSSIYAAGGLLVLAPIGAVVGYHLGKEPLARDEAPPAVAVAVASPLPRDEALLGERQRARALANQPPQMIFPIVNLPW